MLGLGTTISKTGKLGVHDLGIVTSDLVLKHNYDLSSVQPLSDGAAVFDGTSDYISMSSKIVDTADATYCIWVKSTDVNNAILFSHSGGATAEGHKTGAFASNHGTTGKPLLYLNDSLYQYWDDSGLADDGKWHHWAIVVDVDDMTACKLYIDGVLQSQSSRATSDSANSYGNLRIGSYTSDGTTDQFIGGYMCNFGVWTGFLSQAQIKSIMWKNYAGLTSSEKEDLVSWWNLDSVIDSADLGDGDTTVYDNHHGGGDTLGSELVTNGDFATDSDWDFADFTIINGTATVTTDGANQYISQQNLWSNNAKDGKFLKLSWDILENSDSIQLKIGDFSGADIVNGTTSLTSTVGSHYIYLEVNGTGDADRLLLWLSHTAGKTLTIDNVSVKEINGNTGILS